MGVWDYIEKQKQQFFVARDSDKREIQKLALIKERERLEKERIEVADIRRLQADVSMNKQAIHQDMTQGSRNVGKRVAEGFREFGEVVKKFDRPEVDKAPFHAEPNKIRHAEVDEHPFRRTR